MRSSQFINEDRKVDILLLCDNMPESILDDNNKNKVATLMADVTRKEIEEFVYGVLKQQVEFCQQYFNLTNTWRPYVKLNFSGKNKASQAGRNVLQKPFIVFELSNYLTIVTGFIEYQDYADNQHIGAFKSNDWKTCARALIAHELAHCVQFTLPNESLSSESAFHGLGPYSSGHGEFFRKIYSVLRRNFVNDYVEHYCMGVMPAPTCSIMS